MKSIIDIKEEHLMKCAELYVRVFNAEPWNDKWSTETAYKRLLDIYNSPGFAGIICLEDDDVKGAVFGNCEQWYEGLHFNLKEMFVSNELQGKGIGSELLKFLEEELIKRQIGAIFLFTSKGNLTSQFYIKNCFKELDSMAMMIKSI